MSVDNEIRFFLLGAQSVQVPLPAVKTDRGVDAHEGVRNDKLPVTLVVRDSSGNEVARAELAARVAAAKGAWSGHAPTARVAA